MSQEQKSLACDLLDVRLIAFHVAKNLTQGKEPLGKNDAGSKLTSAIKKNKKTATFSKQLYQWLQMIKY